MTLPYDFENFRDLKAWLDTLPEEKLVVGLYVYDNTTTQDEWLNPLARHLREHGFATIGIVDPSQAQQVELSSADATARIPAPEIPNLERINVFIISDLDSWINFPSSSRILACCHGTMTKAETCMPCDGSVPANVDGWLCSYPLSPRTREWTSDIMTGFHRPDRIKRKSGNFHIIPCGYPRAGALAEQLAGIPSAPDAIVYAPVGMVMYPDKGGMRVKQHGEALLRVLLQGFPDKKVIFRPYKTDIDREEVKNICAAFSDEKRFLLDTTPQRLLAFSRGEVLITDYSHIGPSFAICTGRPAIVFTPWEEDGEDVAETATGYWVRSYESLLNTVKKAMSDAAKQRIDRSRKEIAMPVENALAELAALIRDFFEDRPRPDWLTIRRNDWSLLQDEKTLLEKLHRHPATSAALFLFRNPESPLLAAAALEDGLRQMPQGYIRYNIQIPAGRILGKDLSGCRCYSDINEEDIKRLWAMSRWSKPRLRLYQTVNAVKQSMRRVQKMGLKKAVWRMGGKMLPTCFHKPVKRVIKAACNK